MRFNAPEVKGPFVASDLIPQFATSGPQPLVDNSDEHAEASAKLSVRSELSSPIYPLLSSSTPSPTTDAKLSLSKRPPLDFSFSGLTLWFEPVVHADLKAACTDVAATYGTFPIPRPHATAIYGIEKWTVAEACERLHRVKDEMMDQWRQESGFNGSLKLDPPLGLTVDACRYDPTIPSHFCTMAWVELTYPTNPALESFLNHLHALFEVPRDRHPDTDEILPAVPHVSLGYDNYVTEEDINDDTTAEHGNRQQKDLAPLWTVPDLVSYVAQHESLMGLPRELGALSLWDTRGRIDQWTCLDRVSLLPQL